MQTASYPESAPRQLSLALEAAPAKVRRHGLRDAHVRPLVSRGKRRDGSFSGSFRVSPQEAWSYPSIELRTGNSWPVLVLDCDGRDGTERLAGAVLGGEVLPANWIVTRRSGGSHGVWCLSRPVHRGASARQAPLTRLARIAEYYAQAVGADTGYTGVLAHNPMARAHGPGLVTNWGRRAPYTLDELATIIPFGWRVPRLRRTGIGRNCDLFRAGMRWAGSPANLRFAVLAALMAVNQGFEAPLDQGEVAGIARSVERYRQRWIAAGRFGLDGGWNPDARSRPYDHSPEAQGRRGRRSGEVRRKGTEARDAAIVKAVTAEEHSIHSVAKAHGLTRKAVRKIVARDAPLFGPSTVQPAARPWEAEGVSRRTWYRNRKRKTVTAGQAANGRIPCGTGGDRT